LEKALENKELQILARILLLYPGGDDHVAAGRAANGKKQ